MFQDIHHACSPVEAWPQLPPSVNWYLCLCACVCMWCAMVGLTAAVDTPVKRGNGKGQNSRQSPDRPVSSVTPTHASPSGPGQEQRKGKQLCWGLVKQNTQESWQVAELGLKLRKGEPWWCYVYLGEHWQTGGREDGMAYRPKLHRLCQVSRTASLKSYT